MITRRYCVQQKLKCRIACRMYFLQNSLLLGIPKNLKSYITICVIKSLIKNKFVKFFVIESS